MTSMPIQNPAVPPAAIKALTNGGLPLSALEQVDERTSMIFMMASKPARGMRALRAAFKAKFGIELSSTNRYRPFSVQYSEFIKRHKNVDYATYLLAPSTGARRRVWSEGVSKYGYASAFWVLIPGNSPCAVPGTSPHGDGCADDTCLPGGAYIGNRTDIMQWMYENVRKYGFMYSLTSELWHIHWVEGDNIPQAVLDYEASIAPKPTPPKPTPPTPTPTPTPKPTPPNGDDDMHTEIWTIEGHRAQFLAEVNSRGVALSCYWSGPGGDGEKDKGDETVAAHINAGAVIVHHAKSDLRNVYLMTPLPTNDGDWQYRHFANVEA